MRKGFCFIQENKAQIESLQSEIVVAFTDAEQPSKDNIALHECEECRIVRKDFVNTKWQEIKDETLVKNYDKIPLLSPDAFRYFLPAYLLYTLKNFDDELSDVCEFTLYALTPDKNWKDENGEISSYWLEKFSLFSDNQMQVVYRFLELAKQNPIYRYEIASIERAFDRLKTIKTITTK